MSPDVIFLMLVAVPVLLLMLLRVNAALVFLSTCLGAVLLQYVGGETNDFFHAFMPKVDPSDIKLGLVLLPVVLTSVFMIKTVKGNKIVFNLLPAIGTGLLLALLLVPLLPSGVDKNIVHSQTWHQLQNAQALIVGVSALLCLFFLWLQRPKAGHEEKRGKKH
jgi:hypothetical protein